jgi:hypothetical protein
MKQDDLSPQHLEWLVESRAANQRAALNLFKLFQMYPEGMKSKEFSLIAQNLVAACFSLWRAAFLADKTGKRHAVFEDARNFLGKMLVDNAITYPQDRSAREWTFNYYMNNAKDCLLHLSKKWEAIETVLSLEKRVVKKTTTSQRRWDRHHKAFEFAVRCLAAELATENSN